VHIFLGITYPHIRLVNLPESAYLLAQELVATSAGVAQIFELPPLELAGIEGDRLLRYLKSTVGPAQSLSDEHLIRLVAGNAAVLAIWKEMCLRDTPPTVAELEQGAADALSLRYLDLERFLGELNDDSA
jgi:hypothetical protein